VAKTVKGEKTVSEKRILCLEVSGECKYLLDVNRPALAHLCESTQGLYCAKNFSWKPIVKETCKFCQAAKYQGITREQAIKQMTDAIFKEIAPCLKPFYKVPKGKRGCVKVAAEAALNALLEANACK
jgi:hypothetical protein